MQLCMKRVKKLHKEGTEAYAKEMREYEILRKLSHPGIIKFVEVGVALFARGRCQQSAAPPDTKRLQV
jgi:hypothetical protein